MYLGLLGTASLAFLLKGKYRSKLSKIDFRAFQIFFFMNSAVTLGHPKY
jgi:hypothetical protein